MQGHAGPCRAMQGHAGPCRAMQGHGDVPGLCTVLHRDHCVLDAGLGTLMNLGPYLDQAELIRLPGSFLGHK